MQHLLPKWGMVLYRHHLSLSLDQQERATPSSRQDVRPSRAEQRPAGAVPSPDQRAQQPRDAGILCLLPAPTRNRAPRAGTAAPAAPGPSGAAAGSRRCRGRYKAGEKEPDPKTWKANFRCAMNSLPDIEEVKDQSRNKGSSAVRVYRMLPPLTKNQRKERKSKSSRDAKSKAKRKSCGDSSPDTFSDGLSSSTLPDDHSSYTAQSYMGQDLEIERALTPVLSSCAVSSTLPDWHMPGEIVPDSTSDLYSFQVSPMPSTSEAATDEDEEGKLTDDIMKFLEQSGWQPTNVDGKGYLLNEPGAQPPSVYEDFSCKEETEVDSHGGYIGLISSDLKNMDTSWLDSLLTPVRLPSIQAIPCAP
ncbi:interferon regulatory factor 1 isoform X2 [Equus quagga]|uniref:interferon regulatory factor 1 isoform X2 n=1 Tax=Equus quagga TaxID=89248 RepID=UPI001EE23AA4|nr:interferon regulatory factor 1 isoform X2 [Equus quagga]